MVGKIAILLGCIAAASASAGTGPAAPDEPRRLAVGLWGGDHLRMMVTGADARLEYDCATGTIDRAIVLDARGRFAVDGSYTAEHGGPARGESAAAARARYAGRVEGDTMKLTVTLDTDRKPIGTFTLKRGDDVLLTKCR